jgi:hypothetical protein
MYKPLRYVLSMATLSRELIWRALVCLGGLADAEGVKLEVCIYGGAALMLAYDSRAITKDVDAVVRPSDVAQRLARRVAEELALPDDWLNDDVKMFVAPNEGLRALPWDSVGIAVTVPTASYLLAMKALACRKALPGYEGDIADLRFLLRKMEIASVSQVQEHIDRYYPDDVIRAEDEALISELIEEVRHGEG